MESPDARAVIDLGATRVKFGYSSDGQSIASTNTFRLDQYRNPKELFTAIRNGNPKIQKIPWVVGVPSPVEDGRMADTPNLTSHWRGSAISDALNDLEVGYVLENDANLAALGVYHHGDHDGTTNLICLTLGTGIGGGIIVEGELYRGHSGAAGEVGHMTLVPGGRPCECGNQGCFEQYGSASGLTKTYEQLTGDHLPADTIADRYPADESAKKAVDAIGTHLGRGIGRICNILEPGKVILTGGLSGSVDHFRHEMRQSFEDEVFAKRVEQTPIESSTLEQPALHGGLEIPLTP